MRAVGDFDYVFINTCHGAYAEPVVTLPIYNVDLVRAIDYQGVTAFKEIRLSNDKVRIELYRAFPKNARAMPSRSPLSNFLQRNNVPGYRASGKVSTKKPEGLITLYDPSFGF